MRTRQVIFILLILCASLRAQHDTVKVKDLMKVCGALFNEGQYNKMKELSNEAYQLSVKNNYTKGKIESLRFYGVALERTGNSDSAIYFYNQVIQMAKENGLRRQEAQAYHNIGFAAYLQSSFEVAVEAYLKAISIREEIGDTIPLGWSENNLGLIYWRQKSIHDGLKHFQRANDLFKAKNFKEGLAISDNNIGLIYEEDRDHDAALKYYKLSYAINKEIDNKSGIALTLNNIGGIYRIRNNVDSAEAYFKQALEINREINNLEGLELNYRNLAEIFRGRKDYKAALENVNLALEVSEKGNLPQGLIEGYRALSLVYEDMGDYKRSLEANRKYVKLNDSLNFGDKLADMEAKYGKEKNEKQIELLQSEKAIADLEIKRKQWMIYAAVAGSLLLLGIVAFSVRVNVQRKRTNAALEQKNTEIVKQKEIIEEKSKDITDSILYAKRIQDAVLPTEESFEKYFSEHFVLFKPRDIVSGDFYWLAQMNDKIILALADCTGHGVPGAFMSIIGHDLLNQVVHEDKITQPSVILSELDKNLSAMLNKKSNSQTNDGMDIAVVAIDKKNGSVTFAGAYRPLIMVDKNGHQLIHGTKNSIGGHKSDIEKAFTEVEIKLEAGQKFYLLSDGFADQFGGPKGKKYKFKQVQEKLESLYEKSLKEQGIALEASFTDWKGNLSQIDDVCIIGIKI
jgi:serine phosphatase RsbU (regulator of sigma subunit)